MAERRPVLMISSRADKVQLRDGDKLVTLSDVRKDIKAQIEKERFLGGGLIRVWINEEETGAGSETAWEECVKQANDCELFITIFDGDAGWQHPKNPGIGICQAEFETAHTYAPRKVALIELANAKLSPGPSTQFQQSLERARLFKTIVGKRDDAHVQKNELISNARTVVRELLLRAANEGARQFRGSGTNVGEALDWSRLNFEHRAERIRSVISENLKNRGGATAVTGSEMAVVPIRDGKVVFVPHAVPAAFTVSLARAMVAQPFLNDHRYIQQLKSSGKGNASVGGPVHLIGCSKGVTESQAMALLGFPDATIVPDRFGVYVADATQKIQLCLLADCRDAASTVHAVQRLFDWLGRSGEDEYLLARAISRRAIVDSIIAQL